MAKIKMEIGGKSTEVELTLDELIELVERTRGKKSEFSGSQAVVKKTKLPNSNEIKDFILSKPAPEYKHTMDNIMLHFLGEKINTKEEPDLFNNLFTLSVRARKKIKKKLGGAWTKNKVGHSFKGGYTEYIFKKE